MQNDQRKTLNNFSQHFSLNRYKTRKNAKEIKIEMEFYDKGCFTNLIFEV